jgi:hypothetical protein
MEARNLLAKGKVLIMANDVGFGFEKSVWSSEQSNTRRRHCPVPPVTFPLTSRLPPLPLTLATIPGMLLPFTGTLRKRLPAGVLRLFGNNKCDIMSDRDVDRG